MVLAGPPTDRIRPQTREAGFLIICRRVVNKGGVMLTLSRAKGKHPCIYLFPEVCPDTEGNTGILPFGFARGRLALLLRMTRG
jgi:hypothetical protein